MELGPVFDFIENELKLMRALLRHAKQLQKLPDQEIRLFSRAGDCRSSTGSEVCDIAASVAILPCGAFDLAKLLFTDLLDEEDIVADSTIHHPHAVVRHAERVAELVQEHVLECRAREGPVRKPQDAAVSIRDMI